jgi:PAS domain S-box-containing protein
LLSYRGEFNVARAVSQRFETTKCLLLRMNPLVFTGNSRAMSFCMGQSRKLDAKVSGAAQGSVLSYSDGIVSLNDEAIIENVNPAVVALFGFTPQQMLGRHLGLILNPDHNPNGLLYETLRLMKTGQCPLQFECDGSGIRDNATSLPVRLILIGLSADGRHADSFALICHDVTAERIEESTLDEIKREGEKLMHRIVPMELTRRFEAGETSFKSQVGSILTITINDLAAYTQTVAPTDVLQTLTKIYGCFDALAFSDPGVRPLKVVGDDYYAVAGVFHGETSDTGAAAAVQFGLKSLAIIEEMNPRMETGFQLRIGVFTGGHLFFGTAGTEQHFNIVGDPIKAAHILAARCVPGSMNVSQATYEAVSGGHFHIEPHEQVDIPEVGVVKTYTLTMSRAIQRSASRVGSATRMSMHHMMILDDPFAASLDLLLDGGFPR